LIREQLCGSNPDLHQQYLAGVRFRNAASIAEQHLQQTGERISVRKLAAAAGVSRGTASRWLANKHFQRLVDSGLQLKKNRERGS